jgi:hypothetical protein
MCNPQKEEYRNFEKRILCVIRALTFHAVLILWLHASVRLRLNNANMW